MKPLDPFLEPPILRRPPLRVAMVVVHSNPLRSPGQGDAGGMTVYVRELGRALAETGTTVDIYTRADRAGELGSVDIFPGVRVIAIEAGEPGLAKEHLAEHLPELAANAAAWAGERGLSYDALHSHYWLSGRVAAVLSRRWQIPFVHTFHTLGKVKNSRLPAGEPPEPAPRLRGESRVIGEADALVVSTAEERYHLVDLYGAGMSRIHLIPPGVDHSSFRPAPRAAAKERLGLGGRKLLLFAGRLQPIKGADTALGALSALVSSRSLSADEVCLMVVGGPSGARGDHEARRLRRLASDLGLSSSVTFLPAQPHEDLATFYQAADVCLVPSRAESFGLVALEAQACGAPVVASAVGGLRDIVADGTTGYLVGAEDAGAFASKAGMILSSARLAGVMGRAAAARSRRFSWARAAREVGSLYQEIKAQGGTRRNLGDREEMYPLALTNARPQG